MAKKPPQPEKRTTVKRKRGTVAARASRSQRIAAGVVSGVALDAIARAEGITREWASHEANSPAGRLSIAALLDSHHATVAALVAPALDVIRQALSASQYAVQKLTTVDLISKARRDETVIVEVGPDHYARLTAVKRLSELMLAGRPAAKEADGDDAGVLTMEDLRVVLAAKPAVQ